MSSFLGSLAQDEYGRFKKYTSVSWDISAYGMLYIDFGHQRALLKSFEYNDWCLASFDILYKYGSWTKPSNVSKK